MAFMRRDSLFQATVFFCPKPSSYWTVGGRAAPPRTPSTEADLLTAIERELDRWLAEHPASFF